jgi:hypothetical protein
MQEFHFMLRILSATAGKVIAGHEECKENLRFCDGLDL